MADEKLSALAQGTLPKYYYGLNNATASRKYQHSQIFNVRDYGVVGDGVTDDTTNLQTAFDAAANYGGTGGVLFFPPGSYLVDQIVRDPGDGNSSIRIIGSGKFSTFLMGYSATGYTLDFPATGGGGGPNSVTHIEAMSIQNSSQNAGTGALRIEFTQIEANIYDCAFVGHNAVNIGSNLAAGGSFGCAIYDSIFNGATYIPPGEADWTGSVGTAYAGYMPGTVGVYLSQGHMTNCRVVNFDIGVAMCGSCPCLIDCSLEANNTAIYVGLRDDGAWSATGGMITGCQTERCWVGIDFGSGVGMLVSGLVFQGTQGTSDGSTISDIVWGAGGGGTATVTTANPHHLSGTTKVAIENLNPASYIPSGLDSVPVVNATVTGASEFTYPLPDGDPGTPFVSGKWNRPLRYGLRTSAADQCTFTSLNGNQFHAAYATVDLSYDGFGVQNNCVLMATKSPSGLIPPPSTSKASWHLQQVGSPGGMTPVFDMVYADLPGESGVVQGGPFEGQEYDIVDSNTATWGATAAGSGSNHVKVRYNGTNWTVVGK